MVKGGAGPLGGVRLCPQHLVRRPFQEVLVKLIEN